MDDWAKGSLGGKRFRGGLVPTILDATLQTVDIFSNPEVSDRNLHARTYGTTYNMAFEGTSRILGFQTVRDAEERVYISSIRNRNLSNQAKARMFRDILTSIYMEEGQTERFYNTLLQINQHGIRVDVNDIAQTAERRRQHPATGAIESGTIFDRSNR